MALIETFKFSKNDFGKIKKYNFGKNWPVVYVIEDKKEVYIGQTTNIFHRIKQHYDCAERRKLDDIHVITDEEFNVSANLDIESWLIQYMSGDGKYFIQNKTYGLKNHNYYDKAKYQAKFEIIWEKLRRMRIVDNTLLDIRNSDLFKYSPYKALTDNQIFVVEEIYKEIIKNPTQKKTFIVEGVAGTGKTVIATFLLKYLKESKKLGSLNVGLVLPMTPIRNTIKKVFSKIKGLKAKMVIGPADVLKNKYDILIVDEAHRLHRPKNIVNIGSHYKCNEILGIDKKAGTELDWILKSSCIQILFYDKNQRVHPSCIEEEDVRGISEKVFTLKEQMRVDGGEKYINFINSVFDSYPNSDCAFKDYDFKIYNDLEKMIFDIKEKDKKDGLSRILAGYSWPWKTKNKSNSLDYDILIDGIKLKWNSQIRNWVNSPNSVDEVGCIHTIQGYGLNYAGVIIGPEIYYDVFDKKIKIDKDKYFDINGKKGVADLKELELYIINIYKTLLTRGIKGTYIFIVDKNLRDYFVEMYNYNIGSQV